MHPLLKTKKLVLMGLWQCMEISFRFYCQAFLHLAHKDMRDMSFGPLPKSLATPELNILQDLQTPQKLNEEQYTANSSNK